MRTLSAFVSLAIASLIYAGSGSLAAQSQAPRDVASLPVTIPIFPLEQTLLFPTVDRPLHIFESRYRAMVSDALKGDRIIGMTTLKPGYEADYAGRPPIFAIGCAGEISSVEELPGGRFNIVLRGLAKFEVKNEDASRPYRLARVEWLPEILDEQERALLRKRRTHLEELVTRGGVAKVPPDMTDEGLVNMIAQHLPLPAPERQALLELKSPLVRAQALIELIESKGKPRLFAMRFIRRSALPRSIPADRHRHASTS